MKPNDNCLISIIVPAFNAGSYISRCVDSVTKQTYTNIELIVVNDCSVDDTATVLEDMASKDSRLKVINLENNVGIHGARSVGLRAAKGDYIGFVDSDDWVATQMYASLMLAAQEHDADIAICGADKVSENASFLGAKVKFAKFKVYHENTLSLFCQRKFGSGVLWNKLYRASLIHEFGTKVLDRSVDASEDYIVNVGCFANAQCVVTLPTSYYYYLVRLDSASRVNNNGANFCRIITAYICCLEIYSHFTPAQLGEIDRLFSSQLRYPDYRVSSKDQLIQQQEALRKNLHKLAEIRPEAIYTLTQTFNIPDTRVLSRQYRFVRACYATWDFWLKKVARKLAS